MTNIKEIRLKIKKDSFKDLTSQHNGSLKQAVQAENLYYHHENYSNKLDIADTLIGSTPGKLTNFKGSIKEKNGFAMPIDTNLPSREQLGWSSNRCKTLLDTASKLHSESEPLVKGSNDSNEPNGRQLHSSIPNTELKFQFGQSDQVNYRLNRAPSEQSRLYGIIRPTRQCDTSAKPNSLSNSPQRQPHLRRCDKLALSSTNLSIESEIIDELSKCIVESKVCIIFFNCITF